MVTTPSDYKTVTAWRDQVETRVRIAGQGPPIVFFHGAFGLQWDPFLEALSRGRTVYAPEFPGTSPGLPDAIKPIDTLWDLVLYYDELLDALGLDSVALLGHSFGGMVAAEVAANSRHRVSKLVLIDPIGLWRDDAPVRNWMATPMTELPKYLFADPDRPLARMLTAAAADTSEAALDGLIQVMWSLACTGKFVWPIPDRGLHKRLHRITVPTLIIWGKQDGLNPPVYADEFARRIKGSRVELIDGAGHVPQLEQQAAVLQLVEDFLR
jgi:pimeloyl-ACP methyl ester carboxylesterase